MKKMSKLPFLFMPALIAAFSIVPTGYASETKVHPKENLCSGHLIDHNPDMLKRIEGPKTFKLFRSNDTKDAPFMSLNIEQNGKANLNFLSLERKDLKNISLKEGEKIWGKAVHHDYSPSTFSFTLTTEDQKKATLNVLTDKQKQITNYQVNIAGIGSTSWISLK